MNRELEDSLTNQHKTIASVKNNDNANACILQAQNHWIRKHQGSEWYIVGVDLTLFLSVTHAVSSKLVTNKDYGILQRYSLQGFNPEHVLWIYSSDKYTETWVHNLIDSSATHPSNRILNVQRDDEGAILDLGDLTFGKG